eukprot:CAMPEP_0172577586 /NCGR_PEP_ID=MMETSP1067-20121228/138304_1 /TAXON_ID=265564 ORGANISM="Thalassiosira punctigera, Strain Tpunct2005C2" /NCGR_SAMPLE_ID=MMETSP1067 /ASSEMBLY_ACC=CAM_ASM_000444 /LENGTH=219 /DNA_ID=CAMNT_0013370275 /DNA_START=830 /DNA_END=1490 /DNA_ORIENTATION=+
MTGSTQLDATNEASQRGGWGEVEPVGPGESMTCSTQLGRYQRSFSKRRMGRGRTSWARRVNGPSPNLFRSCASCDSCGAPRVIYSNNAIGKSNGPSKDQLENLMASLENGYVCGNAINEDGGFFVKRQLRCGDYVESTYYNPATGLKGGRIVTEDVCAICYGNADIVSSEEIRKERNIGGKNPLLICRLCFESNVDIPCSGGRTNMKQKSEHNQAKKRK